MAATHEKSAYTADGTATPPSDHGIKGIVENHGAAVGEAADVYGNMEDAERYGYVQRG
jgi:amino acid transporter